MNEFGSTLMFHLDRGTRPPGKEQLAWTNMEFGKACRRSGAAVKTWRKGQSLPYRAMMGIIAAALFGADPLADPKNYSDWRRQLWETWEELNKAREEIGNDLILNANPSNAQARRENDKIIPLAHVDVSPGEPRDRPMLLPTRVPQNSVIRTRELHEIVDAFGLISNRPATVALFGIRGIGKSTLASIYANQHRERYSIIWTINATSAQSVQAGFAALGARINLAATAGGADWQKVREFLNRQGDNILIIFDGARQPDIIASYLPQGGACHIIITTNVNNWSHLATTILIDFWTLEEAGSYLIKSSGREKRETKVGGVMLASVLDRLPLALRMAAAFCQVRDITFLVYRDLFEETPITLMDAKNFAPVEYYGGNTVATALYLSIAEVSKANIAAGQLLSYLAFLGPMPIPLEILENGWDNFEEPLRSVIQSGNIRTVISVLRGFGLLVDDGDEAGEVTYADAMMPEYICFADEMQETIKKQLSIESQELALCRVHMEGVRLHSLVRRAAISLLADSSRSRVQQNLIEVLHAYTSLAVVQEVAKLKNEFYSIILLSENRHEKLLKFWDKPKPDDSVDRISQQITYIIDSIRESDDWDKKYMRRLVEVTFLWFHKYKASLVHMKT